MLPRGVRIQLVVFAILSVVALTFASLKYVSLPQLVGVGHFEVSAEFKDTSGLYPRALVTYRGVDIGEIRALDLGPNGVMVRMQIDQGQQIPTNTRAEIHSTSAVGEQYLDLVPGQDSGPFLKDGATIPLSRTVEMPQISPVLDSLDNLLQSIPQQQLSRVLKQVDTAFNGAGTDLQHLIDDSNLLVSDAQKNLNPTVNLITDLLPFLGTQAKISGESVATVSDLASFTDQLSASDPDIRKLFSVTPPAANAINGLVTELTPTLPLLLANLTSVGQVLYTYIPQIQTTLVTYPALVARGYSALSAFDGAAKLDLKANINNPPPCITGYIPVTDRRDPSDSDMIKTPETLHCSLANSAIEGVRGARNSPCPNDPARRSSTPAGCGLEFKGASDGTAYTGSAIAPYDPSTRRFQGTDGQFYVLGGTAPANGKSSWKSLLTDPLSLKAQ